MSILGFADEPDFVNEKGTKWWLDKSTTQWAQREDQFGTSLEMVCYLVETSDGYMVRILLDKENHVVAENQNLEAMAVAIDMLKAAKRFGILDEK